jgi:hypothetical protein
MAIEKVKIRAIIDGPGFHAENENVSSFYIRKARNQLDTFNFSVKVDGGSTGGIGNVVISAGAGSAQKIFSGMLLSLKVRPCFEDPSKVIMDGSGTDYRKLLEGKQFTRRQTKGTACWVEITGLINPGIRSEKFAMTSVRDLGGQGGFLLATDSIKNSEAGFVKTSEDKNKMHSMAMSTGDSKAHSMLRAVYITE